MKKPNRFWMTAGTIMLTMCICIPKITAAETVLRGGEGPVSWPGTGYGVRQPVPVFQDGGLPVCWPGTGCGYR